MNRKELRDVGIQGSRGTTEKDGKYRGPARGSFLGRGRRTAILVSNQPGWGDRMFARLGRKNGRVRRTIQRMRAAGEEV